MDWPLAAIIITAISWLGLNAIVWQFRHPGP
jgi:hypothetical protein